MFSEIRKRLLNILSEELDRDCSNISDSCSLHDDLNLDSVDLISLMSSINSEYNKVELTGEDFNYINTFGELVNQVCHKLGIKPEVIKKKTKYWCHYNYSYIKDGIRYSGDVSFIYETEGKFDSNDLTNSELQVKNILVDERDIKLNDVTSTILTFFGKLED